MLPSGHFPGAATTKKKEYLERPPGRAGSKHCYQYQRYWSFALVRSYPRAYCLALTALWSGTVHKLDTLETNVRIRSRYDKSPPAVGLGSSSSVRIHLSVDTGIILLLLSNKEKNMKALPRERRGPVSLRASPTPVSGRFL